MRKYLHHDAATRELRLVYEDYWDGQHERTEYRVTDRRDGEPIRNRPELAGETVVGTMPPLHIVGPWPGRDLFVWTEETPVVPTVKTPCPRAANRRKKCPQCV